MAGSKECVDLILARHGSKVANKIIAIGVETVAAALFSRNLIGEDVNQLVSLSSQTSSEKRVELVQHIITSMNNSEKFVEFLEVLKDCFPRDANDLLQTLEKECELDINSQLRGLESHLYESCII